MILIIDNQKLTAYTQPMTSVSQRQLLQFGGVLVVGLLAGYFFRDIVPTVNQIIPYSCTYNGQTYQSGQGFAAADGCNSCSCQNGQIACTTMACDPGGTGTVGIKPVMPGESEFAKIPDLPVTTMPASPLPVSYVIEHRSALNGRTVNLTGFVVANWLQSEQEKCAGERCPQMDMYMQPSIVLADSASASRNALYDLRILIPEGMQLPQGQYMTGKTVTVWVNLEGSLEGIIGTYAAVIDEPVKR